jgi:acyl-CoA thioesterase I
MFRRRTLPWLLAAVLCAACGSSPASPTAPDPLPPPKRAAVLGDSLAVTPTLEQSFPARLQARVDGQGLRWMVVNAGVFGDTTADGLRRESQVFTSDTAVLVLELGANDGIRGIPTATTTANLSAIVADAQRRNIRVLLCGMETFPTYGVDYALAFHAIFPNVARNASVPLVPFILEGIALNPAFTGPDGVHPNAAGAQRIADTVWPYLLPLLQ